MTDPKKVENLKDVGVANKNDDAFIVIDNEFEQIRKALGMYISSDETDGAIHLFKEILNNSIDELVNPNSNGSAVIVRFDEEAREFHVQDDGRGIPFDRMVQSTTQKHSSTKINRDQPWVKGLAGRNGVGMVIVAALTDYMRIISYRDGYKQLLSFTDGEMDGPHVSKQAPEDPKHGTVIIFRPSEKYLGKINLTSDLVENFLRCMSYVLLNDIKIDYYGKLKPSKKSKNDEVFISYKPQGLQSAVKFMSSNLEFEPVNMDITTPDFDMELSFSYDRSLDTMLVDSYCNYIHTVDHGYHETSVIQALCSFFTREARKIDPNSKYEITFDDCRKGLVLAVNCRHMDPKYEGQHKTKIDNKDVLEVGKPIWMETLADYFGRDNGLLRRIITYLRTIARARMESNKIKGVTHKKETTFMDDMEIKGFLNITDRNTDHYSEIYIVEGESAGKHLNSIRDRRHQAILALRGPIDNVTGMDYKTMMTKDICIRLLKALGCGAGPTFDINKLRWNRVIIMTDADIDGSNLMSLIINFIVRFCPDIITTGRLYVAVPPLYLLDKNHMGKYKGSEWIFNIKEYYSIINNIASDMLTVSTTHEYNPKNDEIVTEKLSKNALINFLNTNMEYLIELNALNKKTSTLTVLLEHVCWAKLIYNNDPVECAKYIHDIFEEVTMDINDWAISGSIEGEHVTLIADRVFDSDAKRFMNILKHNSCLVLAVSGKNGDTVDFMTIGDLTTFISTNVSIKIHSRYKGLGEADEPVLFVTTMNPKLRKLYRLTATNMDELIETMNLLHEKTEKARADRRDLLRGTTISYNDIDN